MLDMVELDSAGSICPANPIRDYLVHRRHLLTSLLDGEEYAVRPKHTQLYRRSALRTLLQTGKLTCSEVHRVPPLAASLLPLGFPSGLVTVVALSTTEIVGTLSASLILNLCLSWGRVVEGFKGQLPR